MKAVWVWGRLCSVRKVVLVWEWLCMRKAVFAWRRPVSVRKAVFAWRRPVSVRKTVFVWRRPVNVRKAVFVWRRPVSVRKAVLVWRRPVSVRKAVWVRGKLCWCEESCESMRNTVEGMHQGSMNFVTECCAVWLCIVCTCPIDIFDGTAWYMIVYCVYMSYRYIWWNSMICT